MVGSALAQSPIRYFRPTSGAFGRTLQEVGCGDGWRNDEAHRLARNAEHEVGENLVVPAHADMAAAELILVDPLGPRAQT